MNMLGPGISDRWIEDEVKFEPWARFAQPAERTLLNTQQRNFHLPSSLVFGESTGKISGFHISPS